MKRIAVVISVLVFFGMSQGIGMEKDAMVRKMKENLINFDNSYYAWEDELTFVGNITIKGKNVYIASNFHQWSNRGTSRLVLFDNDLTPLGEYAYLDLIPMVKDKSTILFPCEAEWGNEWNFTNGINRTIRVDGSLYSFEVYNKKIGEWYLIDLDKDILHLNVEKRLKESKMKENLINLHNSYYAWKDELTFVGNITIKGKNVYIASNFHQWSNRGTSRLVLFDNDLTPLGEYAYLDLIPMVKDKSTILFPCEAEWGNEWNFTNGINRTIRVDGSLYSFEVYNKKIGEWYLIDLDKDILHLNVEKRLKEIEKIEGITDTY